MKPREIIATTRTPDGGEMVLCQHDRDFTIEINGHSLMQSRRHESELELHLIDAKFHVRRFRVPAYAKSKTTQAQAQSHFILVASENESSLPPGGGQLRTKKKSKY